MIYAVHILDQKYVKVGFTDKPDVAARITNLQTGNPFEISELFTTHGTLMQERAIHSALTVAFCRIRCAVPPNEWYPGRHPFMQKFLEHLRFGADAGLAFADKYSPNVKQPGKDRGADKPWLQFRWAT